MAVSGKTAAPHEIPYYLSSDAPPDMAAVTKAMADRLHARLGAVDLSQLVTGGESNDGKLIIVKDGAAAYQAMKGDATIAEDGTLTVGNKKITEAKLADAVAALLHDERVPLDESVTWEKLADDARHFKVYPPTLIPGEHTRNENAYATLGIPDQVTNIFVPAGGEILVDYSAIVECNKEQKARAAVFIGNNQLKVPMAAPVSGGLQAAVWGASAANTSARLTTFPAGLIAVGSVDAYAGAADVATGLAGGVIQTELGAAVEVNGAVKTTGIRLENSMPMYGGWLAIKALPEGTYTVSVRYKTSEGTLKAKERRLLCAVLGVGV